MNAQLNQFVSGQVVITRLAHFFDELRVHSVNAHTHQLVQGKIVEAGLRYAKQNSLRVVPMCSYAAAYIRRNPQYLELTNQERSE